MEVKSVNNTNLNQEDNIESIYGNGFEIAIGTGDVFIKLKLNGKNIKVLYLSYTLAKTLAQKLTSVVDTLEEITNHKMLTTDEVDAVLKNFVSKQNKQK